ncbi:MAG: cytochrome C [Thermodesulfovibrionia bacterium]|nr:cytochrome C [Thermodesulfovibrionia bacterium]
MKVLLISIIVSFFLITLVTLLIPADELFAHGKEKHSPMTDKNEISYTEHIKLLFDKKCAKCHGAQSPVHMEFSKDIKQYKKKMKGPRMDSYTHLVSFIVWPDTGSLTRALNDGKNTGNSTPGNMYKHLGKTEEERQRNLWLFKNWFGNWTLKKWDDIKKEEINKMKLFY